MDIFGIRGAQSSQSQYITPADLLHDTEKLLSSFLEQDNIKNSDHRDQAGGMQGSGDTSNQSRGSNELGDLIKVFMDLLQGQSASQTPQAGNDGGGPGTSHNSPQASTLDHPQGSQKPSSSPSSNQSNDSTDPSKSNTSGDSTNSNNSTTLNKTNNSVNPAQTTNSTDSANPTSATPSSNIDQTNGPISLSGASVRVDPAGTNYISNNMLQSAEANGGQLKTEAQYDAFIDANAGKFGLDPAIVKREYRAESSGNPNAVGDTSRSAADGGNSLGLLQVSQGLLVGGVWAHPGIETSSGTQLTQGDLENNPEVQLLSGMQHLADYKNEAAASLGAGASPEAIYTEALGNYVGHDQAQYISNIENRSLS